MSTYLHRVACIGIVLLTATVAMIPARAQTASGTLLAVIRGDKMGPVLAFIDPIAARIVARVPVGAEAHVVDVSADGKLAFVVNTNDDSKKPDGDTISVVDLVGRKEVRRVPTGDGSKPHDLHVVGGKVYFAIDGYRTVGRYDPARNRMDWMLGLGQVGPHLIAVSRDQNVLIGPNPNSNNVSIVSDLLKGPTGWNVTQLPVHEHPEAVDIAPDGKEAWVSNEAVGGISIIDIAKKAVIQSVDLKTTHGNRLRFTPDGRRVVVVDRLTAELLVVDVASRKLLKKIPLPDSVPLANKNRVYDVLITPDGSRAYVSVIGAPDRSYIAVVDMKTYAVTGRIETIAPADGMAWVK